MPGIIRTLQQLQDDAATRYNRQPGDPASGWLTQDKHQTSDENLAVSLEHRLEGAIATSGAIKFDRAKGRRYGSYDTPLQGTFTYDQTGALVGSRVLLFHSDTGIAFPEETVFPLGKGPTNYLAEEVNYIELICISTAPFQVLANLAVQKLPTVIDYVSSGSVARETISGQNFFRASGEPFISSGLSTNLPNTPGDNGRAIVLIPQNNAVPPGAPQITLNIPINAGFSGQFHWIIVKDATPSRFVRVRIVGQQLATNQVNLAPSETVTIGNPYPLLDQNECYFDITEPKAYLFCRHKLGGNALVYWLQEVVESAGGSGGGSSELITHQDLVAETPLLFDYALGTRARLTTDGDHYLNDVVNMPVGKIAQLIVTLGNDNDEVRLFEALGKHVIGTGFPSNGVAGNQYVISIQKTSESPAYEVTVVPRVTIPANQGPTAVLTVSGTVQEGSVFSINAAYSDVNSDPQDLTASGSTYSLREYLNSTDATNDTGHTGGTLVDSGTVEDTFPYPYEPITADVGKYYRMQYTPRALAGVIVGTPALSPVIGPVLAAPVNQPSITKIFDTGGIALTPSGTPYVGTHSVAMVTTGVNRRLQVSIHAFRSNLEPTISSVTLNGVAMSLVSTSFRAGGQQEQISVYELLDAQVPASGTYNLVVSWSGTPEVYAAKGWLYTGAAQGSTASLLKQADNYVSANTTLDYVPFVVGVPGLLVTFAAQSFWFGAPILPANGQTQLIAENVPVTGSEIKALVFTKYVGAGTHASNYTKTAGDGVNGASVQYFIPAA